jgi:hypothetical protein
VVPGSAPEAPVTTGGGPEPCAGPCGGGGIGGVGGEDGDGDPEPIVPIDPFGDEI